MNDGNARAATIVRFSLERRELANWAPLAALGWNLDAVAPTSKRPLYEETIAEIRTHRVQSLTARVPNLARQVGRFRPESAEKFYGLDRHLSPERVVSVMETYSAHAAQVVRLRQKGRCGPVVVSCFENVPFLYESSRLEMTAKQLVRAHADRFLAITPDAADALCTEGVDASRIEMVPYGVDTERLSPGASSISIRSGWGFGTDRFVLLFAGRLIREKGMVELLQAFKAARATTPDLALVILGRGPDESRIRRVIDALDLVGHANLRGWVETDELPDIYRSADAVVLPSLSAPYWQEQLGFVLIEAMASGVPIVSTRSGSIPWVVGDAGLLADPYDTGELASALINIAEDASLRAALARTGRTRAEADFSLTKVASQLDAVLRRI